MWILLISKRCLYELFFFIEKANFENSSGWIKTTSRGGTSTSHDKCWEVSQICYNIIVKDRVSYLPSPEILFVWMGCQWDGPLLAYHLYNHLQCTLYVVMLWWKENYVALSSLRVDKIIWLSVCTVCVFILNVDSEDRQ